MGNVASGPSGAARVAARRGSLSDIVLGSLSDLAPSVPPSPSVVLLMALVPVGLRLCAGDMAVPGQRIDIEVDADPPASAKVLEIFLTGRQTEVEWLERALDLRARAFLQIDWPLVKDIREILVERRSSLPRRAGRMPHLGVRIEVRGREILVRNRLSRTSLLLEEGEEIAGLKWLIQELDKDLDALNKNPPPRRPSAGAKRQRSPSAPAAPASSSGASGTDALVASLEEKVRVEVFGRLRGEPTIETVWWSPAKHALVVTGCRGKKQKSFAVTRYHQRLKSLAQAMGSSWDEDQARGALEDMYDQAARRVLEVMGEQAGGTEDADIEDQAASPSKEVLSGGPA